MGRTGQKADAAELLRRSLTQYEEAENGCWNFTGRIFPNGYGSVTIQYLPHRCVLAHRHFYQTHVGPIPEKWEIHHQCGNKKCVNPAHLEATTMRRHRVELTPTSIAAICAAKTHCPKGHEYTFENTAVSPKGKRKCRECVRQRVRATNKAERIAVDAAGKAPKVNTRRKKFTPEEVAHIRILLASGSTPKEVGLLLGVMRDTIWKLRRRKTFNGSKGTT